VVVSVVVVGWTAPLQEECLTQLLARRTSPLPAANLFCLWSPGEAATSKEFSQLPISLIRKHASRFCLQPVNTGPRGQEQDTPILSPTQIRRQLW
jgi:hypothetical protein